MSPPYVCQRPLAATGGLLGESGSCESKTSPYDYRGGSMRRYGPSRGRSRLRSAPARTEWNEGLRASRGKKTGNTAENGAPYPRSSPPPRQSSPAAAATTTVVIPAAATTTTVLPAPAVIAATTATIIAAVVVTTVPARSAIRRCRVRSFQRSTCASKDGAA